MLPDDFFPILHHSNTPLSFVWGTGRIIEPWVRWNNSKGELVIVILTAGQNRSLKIESAMHHLDKTSKAFPRKPKDGARSGSYGVRYLGILAERYHGLRGFQGLLSFGLSA